MSGSDAKDAADKAFPHGDDATQVQPGEYVTPTMADDFNSGRISRNRLTELVAKQKVADQKHKKSR